MKARRRAGKKLWKRISGDRKPALPRFYWADRVFCELFEPTKGDSVRRLYRVTVQYGPMLVQISERTEMGGVKLILPDLIIQDRMFDPDFKIE